MQGAIRQNAAVSLITPILNESQLRAFDAIENQTKNILILGQAGTGKSTFVTYLKSASKKAYYLRLPDRGFRAEHWWANYSFPVPNSAA